jgi:hypothetical protein
MAYLLHLSYEAASMNNRILLAYNQRLFNKHMISNTLKETACLQCEKLAAWLCSDLHILTNKFKAVYRDF